MKVQFLKSHPEFAYFKGDNADIDPERAQDLIKSGHVILFPGESPSDDTSSKSSPSSKSSKSSPSSKS